VKKKFKVEALLFNEDLLPPEDESVSEDERSDSEDGNLCFFVFVFVRRSCGEKISKEIYFCLKEENSRFSAGKVT